MGGDYRQISGFSPIVPLRIASLSKESIILWVASGHITRKSLATFPVFQVLVDNRTYLLFQGCLYRETSSETGSLDDFYRAENMFFEF